jgi:hypothetical protein
MIAASAYVLNVPPDRRELILDRADENHYYPTRVAAEPVPFFQHSKRAALIVLASFENGAISCRWTQRCFRWNRSRPVEYGRPSAIEEAGSLRQA